MKTEDLLNAIVADQGVRSPPPTRMLLLAVLAGALAAVGLFLALLGPRPDVLAALATPGVMLKLSAALLLAGTSFLVARRLASPGSARPGMWWLIAPAPVLVALGVCIELAVVPPALWGPRLLGSNALLCLVAVPGLAALPLAALLVALRRSAPTRPALAGAAAGLLAGGLAAFVYANHCTNDSALYVATWYALAVGAVTLAGAAIGRRVLRW